MAKAAGKTKNQQDDSAHAPDKRKPKRAVVVVHGMGEQRPMETLRSFVESLLSKDQAPEEISAVVRKMSASNPLAVSSDAQSEAFWVIPDARTGSHELARIRASGMTDGAGYVPVTDFYELYYSDLLVGNTVQQLIGWVRGLLLRWPHQVPAKQFSLWIKLWFFSVVAVILLGLNLSTSPVKELTTAWAKYGHERDLVSAVLSLLLFAVLALWATRRARKHIDLPEQRHISGSVHQGWTLAAALFVPTLLAFLTFRYIKWKFFWIPSDVLASLNGTSFLCQVWLILTGWTTLHLLLAGAIFYLIQKFGVPVFGDVARYVSTNPGAVAARQNIRNRGVGLLEELHKEIDGANGIKVREYDSIVIVAHSLGSIVALDVMRLYWAKHIAKRGNSFTHALQELEALDTLCRIHSNDDGVANTSLPLTEFREKQKAAFDAYAKISNNWLINHFVTLGSPLAHAEFLIARDKPRFLKLRRERQLPICPPWLEKAGNTNKVRSFMFERDGKKSLHHAALFTFTKWTGIFDPSANTMRGDFIGGPLRENFGCGIAEVEMKLTKPSLIGLGRLVTHTDYWNPMARGEIANEITADVGDKQELNKMSRAHMAVLRKLIWNA